MKFLKPTIFIVLVSFWMISCQKEDNSSIDDVLELNKNTSINLKSKSSNAANIYDTYDKALARVREMKSSFGNGVSSLMVIQNNTNVEISLVYSKVSHGLFYKTPPNTIPVGKFAAVLGVKTSGTATGFEGFLSYEIRNGSSLSVDIGADVPFIGDNGILGDIRLSHATSSENYEYDSTKVSNRTDGLDSIYYNVTAEMLSDKSSIEVFYKVY